MFYFLTVAFYFYCDKCMKKRVNTTFPLKHNPLKRQFFEITILQNYNSSIGINTEEISGDYILYYEH